MIGTGLHIQVSKPLSLCLNPLLNPSPKDPMASPRLPSMRIRNLDIPVPVIQGGMGIGLSSYYLAGSVAREGGMGVLSSAALDRIVSSRHSRKMKAREAAAQDVRDARFLSQGRGAIGM